MSDTSPPLSRYVLMGRIVTMAAGVIANGAICVDNGKIVHVLSSGELLPNDFTEAPRINTEGTIYPGFIELHNHLCYNAMPLWDVPIPYTNNSQWRNHEDYRRLITKPSQVLAGTEGITGALVRWVECRSLLGGVTTSQGITLSSAAGIPAVFKGLIRNVEHNDPPLLKAAGTRIANPKSGEAQAYLDRLGEYACYLQHLSEGTDNTARGWFHNLKLSGDDWGINDALCGIHSTALHLEDFAILKHYGSSMVWSPLSNFLLYGKTANIRAAKDSGILMGIGCDWSPSGSKNLLGELKVAWLTSEEEGQVFTAEELIAMATVNAAKILKWHEHLGTIEENKLADLVIFEGADDDPYMQVIEAPESSIIMVIINGVPRVGKKSLMQKFNLEAEDVDKISVGGVARWLYLAQEDAHELVNSISLTQATERLSDAMQRLPELAQDIEASGTNELFSGGTGGVTPDWRVVLDFFEEDAMDLASAARPLTDFVTEPMQLSGITVADDPSFLPQIMVARFVPEFIKKKLPALYGQEVPIPDSANFLLPLREQLPSVVLGTTAELRTVMRAWGELTTEERSLINDQALLVLEQNYVHLSFKRAMHAIDPLQRLRLLRYRMEQGALTPEIDFHKEIARTFNSLRDLHTTYRLPYPFKGKVAWLPYMIEEYWERGHRKYLVSKLVGNPGPSTFKVGVEVLHWNGIPIERAVALHADQQAGGNPASRHAQAMNSLTLRPLSHGLPPDEDWVTLHYLGEDGRIHRWTQEWLVFEPGRSAQSIDPDGADGHMVATALGLDPRTDEIQETKRVLYAGGVAREEDKLVRRWQGFVRIEKAIKSSEQSLESYLPTIFLAKEVHTRSGIFGYVRIYTFNVGDAEVFVDEFVRLVKLLPERGLIIDVRGNGGGLIYAAEQLLQVLTPNQIEPQVAQFSSSRINLAICRAHEESTTFRGLVLRNWIDSIVKSIETGATHSLPFPITPPEACNNRGQQYYGPVLLITDALCYSATDMFASGFRDHGIGQILGIGSNTGAGGANVWSHAVLRKLTTSDTNPNSPYAPLPHGADLRVAIRRVLRTRSNAGVLLEDYGIAPDEEYRMRRNDLLHGNRDLLESAGRLLAEAKVHMLSVTQLPAEEGDFHARVDLSNANRLDILLNGRPWRSLDIGENSFEIQVPKEAVGALGDRLHLELKAYEGGKLVSSYRRDLLNG